MMLIVCSVFFMWRGLLCCFLVASIVQPDTVQINHQYCNMPKNRAITACNYAIAACKSAITACKSANTYIVGYLMGYGTKFAQLRDSHGLRNRDLADIVGLSEATISRYLSDNTDMPLDVAAKLAQHLGVSLDEVVGIAAPTAVPPRSDGLMTIPIRVWDAHEAQYNRQLRTKNIALVIFSVVIGALLIYLLTFIALDLLNGSIGWVRYAATIDHRSAQSILSLFGVGT